MTGIVSLIRDWMGFNRPVPQESVNPPLMTPAQEALLLQALNSRGMNPCHRCGRTEHSLQPGFGQINMMPLSSDIIIGGGPTIPVVFVVCVHCGLVNSHAIGALGLLGHPEFDFD